MDGVAIITELLGADSNVVAIVPAVKISAGVLAQSTTLPAISVSKISGVDRNILSPTSNRMVMERVQVTALSATYPEVKSIIRAVRHAIADFIGSAASMNDVTIHTDSAGPDFMDDKASIHMSTQDFIVGYNEPR
jgi:hypothetical protein